MVPRAKRRRARAPRVTVIIPTYNWAPALRYAIRSVLAQTMPDFDLFVIGDHCTDESADVVQAFRDPRVTWTNLPVNSGHQSGPNSLGLEMARTELIAYLGHDDLWLPHHLAVLLRAMDDQATTSFAHTLSLQVDPGRAPHLHPPPGVAYHSEMWLPPSAVMQRRSQLRAVGGWSTPAESGDLDPETALGARLSARFGMPTFVPRLTNVKLPAAHRRDVYRDRPCDEQDRWWSVINSSSDPETELHLWARPHGTLTGEDDPFDLLPGEVVGRVVTTAQERHRLRRIVKGLDAG